MLAATGEKWRLLFVTIEQRALREGEAVRLRWGDVDTHGLRLRLPRSATKRGRARWVYLPDWLVEAIEATRPLAGCAEKIVRWRRNHPCARSLASSDG